MSRDKPVIDYVGDLPMGTEIIALINAERHRAALELIVQLTEDAKAGDAAVSWDANALYTIARKALRDE